jgi:putative FmdB family regulatory protein
VPLYEFRCRDCGRQSEHFLRGSSPDPVCPSCQSGDLERVISKSVISSSQTRNAARRSLRGRNREMRKDAQHEEHKRLHDHHD